MRKTTLFCLLLAVVGSAYAGSNDPFVGETADSNPLPNLLPLVRQTVPEPAVEQPPLRGMDPPEALDPGYAAVPDIDPRDFPSGPRTFDPAESFTDAPMSSAGRWLHSAVIANNKMYVYGGISTYTDKLMNDVWLFNYQQSRWNQFQRSYIPPMPPGTGRPDDVPTGPAFKGMPSEFALPKAPVPVIQPEYRGIISGVGFAATEPAANVGAGAAGANRQGGVAGAKGGAAKGGAGGAPRAGAAKPGVFMELGSTITASAGYMGGESGAMMQPTVSDIFPNTFPRQPNNAAQQRRFRDIYAASERESQRIAAARASEPERFLQGSGTANPASLDWRGLIGLRPESDGLRDWPAVPTDLWEYDLDTKIWKCVLAQSENGVYPAPMPEPRLLHSAVTVSNRMVVFGGASHEGKVLGDTWTFNPLTSAWAEARPNGTRPLPREGHCSAVIGDTVYVFGGISIGFQPFNDLWAYNTIENTWTEISPNQPMRAPAPRWLHSCAAFSATGKEENMMFYVFGGVGADYVPMNDFQVFDMSRGGWAAPIAGASIPPFPRMLANMVFMGSRLHVFGGIANNIAFEDLHTFDVLTNTWSEALPMGEFPFARGGASAAVVNPPVAKTPGRPKYDRNMLNAGTKPNYRWNPRYRKTWNDNRFMIIFGGAGVVRH